MTAAMGPKLSFIPATPCNSIIGCRDYSHFFPVFCVSTGVWTEKQKPLQVRKVGKGLIQELMIGQTKVSKNNFRKLKFRLMLQPVVSASNNADTGDF